jgi:hypothetical protein
LRCQRRSQSRWRPTKMVLTNECIFKTKIFHSDTKMVSVTDASSNRYSVMFGSNSFYVFLRLHHTTCERLSALRTQATVLAAQQEEAMNEQTATASAHGDEQAKQPQERLLGIVKKDGMPCFLHKSNQTIMCVQSRLDTRAPTIRHCWTVSSIYWTITLTTASMRTFSVQCTRRRHTRHSHWTNLC